MSKYTYVNTSGGPLYAAGVLIPIGDQVTYESAQPELDKLLGHRLDRYIDGVKDNTSTHGGAPVTSADVLSALGLPLTSKLAAFSEASATGLVVSVVPFRVGNFSYGGGDVSVVPNGTWYVGVEMSSKQLRTLPRLGHTGWIPLACVVSDAAKIVSLDPITPKLPTCRIPRTMKKVLDGLPIKVVVMGSSLAASGGDAATWPGMVFGAGDVGKYKLPGGATASYVGVGGSPNQYQLAQLGLAGANGSYGYADSGTSSGTGNKAPANGRSALFSGVDLVVISCLANGGDYRLETIEPLARKLRVLGVEVIMVTDNPQNPTNDYATLSAAALYVDGPEVMRVADLYGVEVADTAAYVMEAHLRAGGNGIYADTIHMTSGIPAGPTTSPANGHEVWARAVRSLFPLAVVITPPTEQIVNGHFSDGATSWSAQNGSTFSVVAGVAHVGGNTSYLSLLQHLPTIPAGSTVTLSYDVVSALGTWEIGLASSGSWDAGGGTPGGFTTGFTGAKTKTFSNVSSSLDLFVWNSSGSLADTVVFDNVSVVVESAVPTPLAPGREGISLPLPSIRVVTDMKTPADAFVILPRDENYVATTNPARGTLGAHPWGAGSFSRNWGSYVGANEDLLTLTVGKSACVSGICPVGFALVHYRDATDGACAFDLSINGTVYRSVSIGAAPFANEWFVPLIPPTEFAATTPADGRSSYLLTVTSGTLKIAALIALTADVSFLLPEEITYVGNWLPFEVSRSGLWGRPTDTLGASALVRCTGRRLAWVLSANPGSKSIDMYSDREQSLATPFYGNYHVKNVGGLLGPNAPHYIRCAEANNAGSQANGHALHIGGAVVINDR